MKIPTFNNIKFVDKDGFLTNEWRNILDVLFSQLSIDLGETGINVPSVNSSEIEKIRERSPDGKILIDEGTKEFKVKLNDVFRTIRLI